jgi:hypothetical protein
MFDDPLLRIFQLFLIISSEFNEISELPSESRMRLLSFLYQSENPKM